MNKLQPLLAATVLVGGLVSQVLAADSSQHHRQNAIVSNRDSCRGK
jgi:hypothetical protein